MKANIPIGSERSRGAGFQAGHLGIRADVFLQAEALE
jgi:hypothetical protein